MNATTSISAAQSIFKRDRQVLKLDYNIEGKPRLSIRRVLD